MLASSVLSMLAAWRPLYMSETARRICEHLAEPIARLVASGSGGFRMSLPCNLRTAFAVRSRKKLT